MIQLATFCASLLLICASANPEPGKSPYPKLPKHIKDNFVYIPAGEVSVDNETVELAEFFIKKGEVTNIDYLEFLAYLKQSGETDKLHICMVDTAAWNIKGAYNEPFAKTYHKHPAYHEYPVVNISHGAAALYCEWLEEMLNNSLDGLYEVEVRLPERTEWMRAARPDNRTTPYAWDGPYLRNAKGSKLCNFYPAGAESITRDPVTGELKVVENDMPNEMVMLAPAISFGPSQSGVYNLNGNAAEMVSEPGIAVGGSWASTGYDVRNKSVAPFNKPSPYVGFRPVLIIK